MPEAFAFEDDSFEEDFAQGLGAAQPAAADSATAAASCIALDHRNRFRRRRQRSAAGREPERRHLASDARSRSDCANQGRPLGSERKPGRCSNRPRRRSHDAIQINEAPEPLAPDFPGGRPQGRRVVYLYVLPRRGLSYLSCV